MSNKKTLALREGDHDYGTIGTRLVNNGIVLLTVTEENSGPTVCVSLERSDVIALIGNLLETLA